MKKIILLLSLASLGFSCSSDDDGGSSVSNEDLVGRWTLTSRSSEIEDIDPLDECEMMSYYEFFESEFEFSYYENSFFTEECSVDESDFEIVYDLVDDKVTVNEEELFEVDLSDNTLTLTFTRIDNFFNLDSGENEEDSYEEVEVYTRAQ